MIIGVYGASSRLGHQFIGVAAAAGHALRLHYRAKPAEQVPENATVIVGSLADPTAVREVLRGADVAVVLLGHKHDARVPYLAAATKLVVSTMKTLEQSRLLVVTGAMVGESAGNMGLTMKLKNLFARRSAHDGMMEDRDEQERLIRASRLDGWTVVKPGTLTDTSATDKVQVDSTLSMGAGSQVSRATLARVLLQEIEQPRFTQQAVYVAER
ncbi:NAD(P)H-binding protein [Gemmatimonas sp.]|jgi:putative NADH-flavin reductase|uniref:NAD(P)-dependent oxidoreductase n=1 Tax=Gemmatimonas sp. TaxID=1962908 RepID=UPI00262233E6|nr:NAD(P)H-binding protein [Gemmatimonas sp.]